ncbi:peptide synthetase [Mycolicibacterium porcinum]|uniref:amino acid synthesis family protein n=1 Tax=Mycolicibacterium porcinum TaxID=39693 RepID=UPI00080B0081|nr:amino acid synthesis family protein [Mycolicibacterium porcinum]OCB14541.1 peptide synthetase [Mycolicibacterium porcinum]
MSADGLTIRKIWSQVEETRLVAGTADDQGPLRKVAVCAVVTNPCAGEGYVADLSQIIEGSEAVAKEIGAEAARLLAAPVQSYGKGGIAGSAGEQEHINAALTSVFGDTLRAEVGGGEAWITSVTKIGGVGVSVDVPLAFKDDVWVRSHYDAMTITVPDGPQPNELVVIAVVANRGRINARLGGKSVSEALNVANS